MYLHSSSLPIDTGVYPTSGEKRTLVSHNWDERILFGTSMTISPFPIATNLPLFVAFKGLGGVEV